MTIKLSLLLLALAVCAVAVYAIAVFVLLFLTYRNTKQINAKLSMRTEGKDKVVVTSAASAQSSAKHCPVCGAYSKDSGAAFCSVCGSRM